MDATIPSRLGSLTGRKVDPRPWIALALATTVALGAVALTVDPTASVPATDGGLTAQQIVIRGEVADRYAATNGTLSAQQIVIRGEVADRYAATNGTLSAQQIVIRGEVADRYGD
jgi:hypothetical protein